MRANRLVLTLVAVLVALTAGLAPSRDDRPAAATVGAPSGYWLLDAEGRVYPFGDAAWLGDPVSQPTWTGRPSDIEATTDNQGYRVLLDEGTSQPFGTARAAGSILGVILPPGERATSVSNADFNTMVLRADGFWEGSGFWYFTDKGKAQGIGRNAYHYGDMSGTRLLGPVVDSVATPTFKGYYMVAADGGIFAFGDAAFRGSMGGKPLNAPVVGIAPDPDGVGYWMVASDGGIFAFEAPFRGSMGGKPLNKPVVGMVAYGDGYLLVAADGGIFNFSSKPFSGSLGANPPLSPIISVAAMH